MTSKKQRRISALFTALAALVIAFAGCSNPLGNSIEEEQPRTAGSGTPKAVYNIDILDADGFEEFAAMVLQFPNDTVNGTLFDDVDLSGVTFAPIGINPTSGAVTAYTGTFEGNGYTLSNISITRTASFTGLFALNNGTIQNLTVTGNITADAPASDIDIDYIGGIAGYNDINGTIQNVVSKVNIGTNTPDNVHNFGGIAGFNGWDSYNTSSPHYEQKYQPGGWIRQCRNEGNLYGGFNKVGGIAGENASVVEKCSNYGTITVHKSKTGWIGAGGIVGRNGNNNEATEYGIISDCYNRAPIYDNTTSSTSHDAYGGITGWCNNLSVVENCYTTGDFIPEDGQKNPIIGRVDSSQGKGINNYSLDTIFASSTDLILTGTRRTDTQMRQTTFVTELGSAYVLVAGKYPILLWEVSNPPPSQP